MLATGHLFSRWLAFDQSFR